VKVAVVPLHRVSGPGAFEAAGNRVRAHPGFELVLPAETLLLEEGALRFWTNILRRNGSAVGFAERMAASDQRDGLLVVHGHAAECFPNVPGGGDWIGFAVRSLGIDVDQPHLNGAERIFKHAVTGVTLVSQPRFLFPPVDVCLRLPAVLA